MEEVTTAVEDADCFMVIAGEAAEEAVACSTIYLIVQHRVILDGEAPGAALVVVAVVVVEEAWIRVLLFTCMSARVPYLGKIQTPKTNNSILSGRLTVPRNRMLKLLRRRTPMQQPSSRRRSLQGTLSDPVTARRGILSSSLPITSN